MAEDDDRVTMTRTPNPTTESTTMATATGPKPEYAATGTSPGDVTGSGTSGGGAMATVESLWGMATQGYDAYQAGRRGRDEAQAPPAGPPAGPGTAAPSLPPGGGYSDMPAPPMDMPAPPMGPGGGGFPGDGGYSAGPGGYPEGPGPGGYAGGPAPTRDEMFYGLDYGRGEVETLLQIREMMSDIGKLAEDNLKAAESWETFGTILGGVAQAAGVGYDVYKTLRGDEDMPGPNESSIVRIQANACVNAAKMLSEPKQAALAAYRCGLTSAVGVGDAKFSEKQEDDRDETLMAILLANMPAPATGGGCACAAPATVRYPVAHRNFAPRRQVAPAGRQIEWASNNPFDLNFGTPRRR